MTLTMQDVAEYMRQDEETADFARRRKRKSKKRMSAKKAALIGAGAAALAGGGLYAGRKQLGYKIAQVRNRNLKRLPATRSMRPDQYPAYAMKG